MVLNLFDSIPPWSIYKPAFPPYTGQLLVEQASEGYFSKVESKLGGLGA